MTREGQGLFLLKQGPFQEKYVQLLAVVLCSCLLFFFICLVFCGFFFLLGTGDIHRAQDSLLLFFNQI